MGGVGVGGSVLSAFVFGRGGLGHVDGLLQRPPQVDGSLLDHLPDVFDPVLLVLDAGSLWARTDAVRTGLGSASSASYSYIHFESSLLMLLRSYCERDSCGGGIVV